MDKVLVIAAVVTAVATTIRALPVVFRWAGIIKWHKFGHIWPFSDLYVRYVMRWRLPRSVEQRNQDVPHVWSDPTYGRAMQRWRSGKWFPWQGKILTHTSYTIKCNVCEASSWGADYAHSVRLGDNAGRCTGCGSLDTQVASKRGHYR